MAVRGWGGSVATAIGIAAGASAAQLGLGYGLGIIAWLPSPNGANEATWVASLAWATWIAATSTIIGAICADRMSASIVDSRDTLTGVLSRGALTVAAAVGALATVALVAIPAREAARADTFTPQTIAAGYAAIGVIVGLLVALWAVASRAVAANVIATASWLWLLAVIAVIDGVATGRGLASAQLGVWQITSDADRYWFRNIYLPGAALTLGSALVIGALAAWPAAKRLDGRVGTAVSGGVGPLLVAAAYFLAAPTLVGIRAEQLSAHLLAPYAVIAGLAGSVLVTAISQRRDARRKDDMALLRWPDEPAPEPETEPETDLERVPVPAQPAGADLEDDAYAPARAYVSDSAPASEPAAASTEPARGQASVATPLWPEQEKKKPKRR
ncbi:hypothetical protein RB614_20980 [Phytohabitans sp. ZYX-F-186]|uniref:Uncharacterized protein n=1 Tax=Phytohabitans maris TaxID=3071409 RepID=A0ABU0ZIV8_9ACTN|nr:hypothetical protein [Phytohabitans sp. ZYX-F-186]MDQ7906990.1 hypothetical protein [Phytohabitans sp. ZYX-F-186]